jgi:hypothetical protein
VGHLGRLAAALALIAVVVVPAVAASVPPSAVPRPSAVPQSAPESAGSPAVLGSPAELAASSAPSTSSPSATAAPRLAARSSDPRRALASAADDAADRGITTGSKPGLVGGSVNATSLNLTAEYDAKVSLNFGTRAFKVSTTIQVRNDSGKPIDRIELNTIAARLGGMKLGAVTVAGKAVHPTVDDQTILVPLGGILGAGKSVTVAVAYSATLRSSTTGSNWLFTRTNGVLDAYRWLPWVSRNVPFDRPNHGDPFITPVSPRVKVAITTDRKLVVASTGEPVGTSGLTQRFEATNVRDFVFTAAPDYKTASTTVGAVTVRVFARPGFPWSTVLAQAKHAIGAYQPLVGAYPYKTYDLAQTAGGYGMESPGLTWIPSGVGSANLSYLVHHETAHQWFYGMVGSDQAYEPFTDEAVTDFLARYVLSQRRSSRCSTGRLDLSIYRYSTACYYEVVYIQGGNFIDELRRRMGSSAFWGGLRAYVAENRYGLTSTKRLLDTLDAHTTLNLVPRYEPRFPRLY